MSSNNNCILDLRPRTDADGKKYYIAKLKAPMFIDCRTGVTFLVFTSESGEEQLQIAATEDRDERKNRQKHSSEEHDS